MIKNNIEIIKYKNKNEASKKALEFLLKAVDQNTLLLLSGGTSPDLLYQLITQDKTLQPGAVALVDERYGLPMHNNSNEKMIADTGLTSYLAVFEIPFYGILKEEDMVVAAEHYERIIVDLFKKFPKRVAVMGIGADGHTAGIKPNLEYNHKRLVVSYDDTKGSFGRRITLTFEALARVDEFIILVFGEDKKPALREMFLEKGKELIPAVFYAEYGVKVTLLTDIQIDS